MRTFVRVLFAPIVVAAAAALVGCGGKGVGDRFVQDPDASAADAPDGDVAPDISIPEVDPTLGGPCLDDKQCERPDLACATFKCDLALKRCRATPDDTKCDDGIYCNGVETCDPRVGCLAGPVVDCSSADSCMIDHCVEETHGCEHTPRDADNDGDPAAGCAAYGKDCDDHDPTISSKLPEVCGNKKDDNCNGFVDETPCITPANATCDTALVVKTAGTYAVSLSGTSRSIAASCASMASFPRQIVAAVTVPDGGNKDVDVFATPLAGARIALAAATTCDDPTTETACTVEPPAATSLRLKLRNLAPGTYPIYLFGVGDGKVEMKFSFLAPTAAASNLSCATATTLLDGTTASSITTAEVVDIGKTPTACATAAGPLVYKIEIPSSVGARDLRVRVGATLTGVKTILGFRDEGCTAATNELKCGWGYPADLFRRAVLPGTYYVTVGVSAPSDVTIDAALLPPTKQPSDASCTGAPAIPRETTTIVNLAAHEAGIATTCLGASGNPPLAPDAAYSLKLESASDVLVVARSSGSDVVGLALAGSACTTADVGCGRGYPQRLVRRALPAGDYRVVVESINGSKVSLSTFVRSPAATIGPVGADKCSDTAVVIPSEGGLFTGSTGGKGAKFDESCDAPTTPKGGAPDVVYKLEVAKTSRLIVDMAGSAFTTVVSIRKGAACPGTEINYGCAAGYYVDNAFLDVTVDAGTYWIVVDGYSLASGSYRLDVRVAPPPPKLP